MSTEPVRGRLRAAKPVDWYATESHTFLAPDGRANVLVSSELVEPLVDSDAYARGQGDLLERGFPDYEEHAFEPREVFGGRPGYLRRYSWQPEDDEPVTQVQLYYAEGGTAWTATATASTEEFLDHALVLMDLLDSLQI